MSNLQVRSKILPLLNDAKEKNILWLDTYYLNLSPYTISNMYCHTVWNSGKFNLKYIDFVFQFQFARVGDTVYRLTCSRTPASKPTDNYILEFHCSTNIFDQDPIVLVLLSDQSRVFQRYDLNFFRRYMKTSDYTTELEFKILVKMVEYGCEKNPACIHQEEEFRKIRENFFNEEPLLNYLSYILDIPRVEDIFTGHQNNEFAELKTSYITRTADFAKEITDYMKAKALGGTAPLTDLGLILNYVLKGERKQVDDQDLFKIYFEAHRLGLTFLVDLSRDAFTGRIDNKSLMIEALIAAERVGDEYLFGKVAEKFHSCKTESLDFEVLEKLKNSAIQGRFMLRAIGRQLKNKGSEISGEIGESSVSSTLK